MWTQDQLSDEISLISCEMILSWFFSFDILLVQYLSIFSSGFGSGQVPVFGFNFVVQFGFGSGTGSDLCAGQVSISIF